MMTLVSPPRVLLSRRTLLAGAAAGLALGRPAWADDALRGVTLRVAGYKAGDTLLLKAAGLDDTPYQMKVSTFPSGNLILEAINAGGIDVGSMSETPPAFGAAAGARFRLVAVIRDDVNWQVVLVPKAAASHRSPTSRASASSRIDEKPSANEAIKAASRALRGTIAKGLQRQVTGSLADDDTQLTKFHGIYQQDDSDLRAERGRKRMEKAFSFIARVHIPAGILTPAQWLTLDDIAAERANGTMRLTTRQTVQFHGILKSNLKPAIRAIGDALLDTIAACGDVNRNVICSANPHRSAMHAETSALARAISEHLLPKPRAWHEIWIDGEKIEGGEVEREPLYGSTCLPRKFKIAAAVPPHNGVDVFAHDVGFIAVIGGGAIVGYNVVAGGGMGMTHGEPETFPRTGDIIGFCRPDQAVEVAETILAVQRDNGDRSNRKQARLKYTIERMGLPAFRAELEQRLGYALLPAAHDVAFASSGDALGWQRGDDTLWHHTLFVENGRIADLPERRLLTGLRAIAKAHRGTFIITGNQNLVIAQVAQAERRSKTQPRMG